jgi:putative SOS response-associated peptidase YedK
MCGRFTQHLTWAEIVELYRLAGDVPALNLEPRYNAAPSQALAVCRLDPGDPEGGRAVARLRWGLIPFWAEDAKIGYRTINARIETVAEKPAFRAAAKRRRCLVPADGWYEWRAEAGGKQPYLIAPAATPFSFAGLWERWDKGPEPVESFTILVGPAAPEIAAIHDRMPMIVAAADYAAWLDPATPVADALDRVRATAAGPFAVRKVSRRVNSPANDDPSVIDEVA